jgi:hypothetical protein
VLDAGGSGRDVLLPVEEDSKGIFFWVLNTGGETLTFRNSDDDATISAVAAGAFAIFYNPDGVTWTGATFDQTVTASPTSLAVTANATVGGTLDVTGDTTLGGDADITVDATIGGTLDVTGLTTVGPFKESEVAVTATNDGLTTGIVPDGARHITVTSANSAHIVALPAAVAPLEIKGYVGANGFELETVVSSSETINNVNADGTNSAAIPATTSFICRCFVDGAWLVELFGADGDSDATPTPD